MHCTLFTGPSGSGKTSLLQSLVGGEEGVPKGRSDWLRTGFVNTVHSAGPSGCGKTSLLQSLVGKLRIDSGSILVFGYKPGSR